MTEATVVRDIIDEIKGLLPRAVVYKHHDVSTGGMPDISVTRKHGHPVKLKRTTWIEVKVLDARETPSSLRKRHFDKLQLTNMRLLEEQGDAWYLLALAGAHGTELMLMSPREVWDMMYGLHPIEEVGSEFFNSAVMADRLKALIKRAVLESYI